jgi:hypothetical protein
MIDNLFSNNILKLFTADELTVDYMHLTTEEILTCAGLVIAATPKWSSQRDVITNLMLNVDEESMQRVLMFIDLKAIESAIPKC